VIKRTPYYHKLLSAGAKFQDRAGFATVNFVTSIEDEHRAVRTAVGVFDVFYQVGVEIKGPDAEKVLMAALVNDVRRLDDGGVMYSPVCTESGGIVDDLTCFRFSGDRFWVSPSPSRVSAVADHLESRIGGLRVSVTNLGYRNAYLSVQGPKSRTLLGALTDVDLSTGTLPYFRLSRGGLAGVPDVVISRTGYSGELGYELFFPIEYAEHVWDAVLGAGTPHEVRICGMKSMRSLRIEKGYLLYGLDITTETDPLSAGLGWTVRFDDRGFCGRAALERIADAGPKRRLRLLETADLYPISHGEPVLQGGECVSTVTSGDPGFTLGRTFALAYLPADLSAAGTELKIESKGPMAQVTAKVRDTPPYDPKRLRLRE
jgi:aminomethyltransferase